MSSKSSQSHADPHTGLRTPPHHHQQPQTMEDIQREILRMQQDNAQLESKIHQKDEKIHTMKEKVSSAQLEAEMSEDKIANRMLRRLDSMKREKQHAQLKLKQEEEQRARIVAQIAEVQGQKVELENHIEQEQEFIMHQLQRQLLNVSTSRMDLEKRLQEERHEYLSLLRDKVSTACELHGDNVDASEILSPTEEEMEALDADAQLGAALLGDAANSSEQFTPSRLSPDADGQSSATPSSVSERGTPLAKVNKLDNKERSILTLEQKLNALLALHTADCERVKTAEQHCQNLGSQLHEAQVDTLVQRNRAYKLRADLQAAQNELAYVQAHTDQRSPSPTASSTTDPAGGSSSEQFSSSGTSTPVMPHNSLRDHTKQILNSTGVVFPKPRRGSVSPARSASSVREDSFMDDSQQRSRHDSLQTPTPSASSPVVPSQ